MLSALRLKTHYILKRKQLLHIFCRRKSVNYSAFVVLCAPRTGSTLLHTCLNSHPNILSCGEILRTTLAQQVGKRLAPISEWIFNARPQSIASLGLKLFYRYEHEKEFREAFREVLVDDTIRVIHLRRLDLRRMYVSLLLAQKTGVWNDMKVAKKQNLLPLHIPVDDFDTFCRDYIQNWYRANKLFEAHEVLHLTYEDLTSRQDEVLMQVQEFLGVKRKKLFSLLRKQNPENLPQLISNHQEITDLFKKKYTPIWSQHHKNKN